MNYQQYLDSLANEIADLISYGQEGDYWDFKREWYFLNKRADAERAKKGKCDLLFDILNMANNVAFRDAYIIIGVDNETCDVVGCLLDDVNRRTTEQLSNYLRDSPFNLGMIPKVHVENIELKEKPVEVIVVESSCNVPYFLDKKIGYIQAGTIYARENGKNSPCSEGASGLVVERLWRHRFLLDAPPYNHLCAALKQPDGWERTPEHAGFNRLYIKSSPEYTLSYEDEDDDWLCPEFYCYSQFDSSAYYFNAVGRYHQTVLMNKQCVYLDGGRYKTPTPNWGFIGRGNVVTGDDHIVYKYFIEDSPEWALHNFMYEQSSGEAESARARFLTCVLVFSDKVEKLRFETYVLRNRDIFDEKKSNAQGWYVPEDIGEPARSVEIDRLKTAEALNEMLADWRINGEKLRCSREW